MGLTHTPREPSGKWNERSMREPAKRRDLKARTGERIRPGCSALEADVAAVRQVLNCVRGSAALPFLGVPPGYGFTASSGVNVRRNWLRNPRKAFVSMVL